MTRLLPVFVLVLLLTANGARAYHTRETPLIADHAYTLGPNEWQVGLWRVDVGLHRALTLGTYHFAWLFGFANLRVKARLYANDSWAVSLRPSLFRLDLGRLAKAGSDSKAVLWVVPTELTVTKVWRERFVLSPALVYSHVAVSGSYDEQDARGVLAVSNLQLTHSFEWRVGRVTSLVLHHRLLLFQELGASVRTTLQLDDYTTAEIRANGKTSALDVKNGMSLTLSSVFSFTHFNLRTGLGYGHWSLPAVNLVLPGRRVILDFDLFWRF